VSPALRYLELARRTLEAVRRDAPYLAGMGAQMAELLLDGGAISAPRAGAFWSSEFCGRAGSLMGVSSPGDAASAKDVAFFDLPDPRRPNPARSEVLKGLARGLVRLFAIGRREDLEASVPASRVSAFTGGAGPDEGLFGVQGVRPLVALRHLDQLVRGWVTAGEMIAACTRAGRMPVIWMSVWLEGALVRNAHFIRHDNLREPWSPPLFHDRVYVPPLAEGYAAEAFLDAAEGIAAALERQAEALAACGEWMAEAVRSHRRAFVVAVGHSYPAILDIPQGARYPVEWGASVSDLSKAVPRSLGEGDVVLHLGYGPVDVRDADGVIRRGIRLVHTSPYGCPPELRGRKGFLWFDLPWRPGDASVDVPGYSVRILPMSSTAHTLAYQAVLCELAERLGLQ